MRALRPRLALCVLLLLIPACSAGVNVSRCASPQLATGTGDPLYGDTAIVLRQSEGRVDVLTDDGPVYGPAISPDGRWVAFALATGPYSDTYGYPSSRVAIVAVDSGTVRVLSAEAADSSVGDLQWSSDGTEIAFIRQGDRRQEIVAVRVEDGEERLLLETSELRSATFSWSPDGRELLIPANEDGQSRLLKYSVVTGEYTVLPTDHEVLIRAVWSPDGKRAALIAEIPGTTRIRLWILDTASGDTQPVDRRRGGPVAITWSGRYMIYSYLVTTPGNEEEFNGLPTLMRWDSGSGERTTIAAPGSLALNTISAPNCIIW